VAIVKDIVKDIEKATTRLLPRILPRILKRQNNSWLTFLYFLKGLISGYCQGFNIIYITTLIIIETLYILKNERII
jgi:hypothetical protein